MSKSSGNVRDIRVKVPKFPQRIVERSFSRMSKWRMADVVPQSNRLSQILVQTQCPRDRPPDLRNF